MLCFIVMSWSVDDMSDTLHLSAVSVIRIAQDSLSEIASSPLACARSRRLRKFCRRRRGGGDHPLRRAQNPRHVGPTGM